MFCRVSANLCEEIWRRVILSLNSKARGSRKVQRDGANDVDPGTVEGANSNAFE